MNKILKNLIPILALLFVLSVELEVDAKDKGAIAQGVFVENIDVSGMSKEQAIDAVNTYIEQLKEKQITLDIIEGEAVTVSAGELGIAWSNSELVEEAFGLGKTGNFIKRYKIKKDLEQEPIIFEVELKANKDHILQILEEQCEQYNQEVIEATLKRDEGGFVITDGQTGIVVSVGDSVNKINKFLINEWEFIDDTISLVTKVEEPIGNKEELEKVQDLLGTFGTSFSSSANRTGNIRSAAGYINGTIVYPGEEFSANEVMRYPFTIEDGYFSAGSYLKGKTVNSMGGGVCQVSTTLYNAALLAELEIVERNNHSMTVSYVPLSADAAVAGGYLDLKFKNNTDAPIYIEGFVTNGKRLDFNIYGEETRPENRVVTYESQTVSRVDPGPEVIIAEPSLPVGVSQVSSGRIGYKAKLWKIVTVDGVETSRTEENTSSYRSVSRTATVGVASVDPIAVNEITAAINTGVIDHAVATSNAWAAAIAAQNAAVAPPPAAVDPAAAPAVDPVAAPAVNPEVPVVPPAQ